MMLMMAAGHGVCTVPCERATFVVFGHLRDYNIINTYTHTHTQEFPMAWNGRVCACAHTWPVVVVGKCDDDNTNTGHEFQK
jgi:hypothetical protein